LMFTKSQLKKFLQKSDFYTFITVHLSSIWCITFMFVVFCKFLIDLISAPKNFVTPLIFQNKIMTF
jgi:hypothetical protein